MAKRKPAKDHPWRFGIGFTGPLRFSTPDDSAPSPVRILSAAEIDELGYSLIVPTVEILEARRMCQKHHPDKGGDADTFQFWKEKLDRLRRRR
jgi:hypothetical protein